MIYFDNAATTKVDELVIEEMIKTMNENYANIDSNYNISLEFQKKLSKMKQILKTALGLNPNNFSFTSGGGEANNLALTSVMRRHKKGHFIVSAIEHPSLFNTAKILKEEGYELDILGVDNFGNVDLEKLEELIREDTILVSIMGVNNEIGTIQDVEKIAKIIKGKNKNTYYHIDYVQGLNHHRFDFSKIDVDLLSISSHKIHGPKGIGALYIKDGVKIKEQIYGDNKYNKVVPRTFPNELVVGFLKAIEIGQSKDLNYILELKKYFIQKLNSIEGIVINSPENSSVSIINVSFLKLRSEIILNLLSSQNIYVSAGSACSANAKDSDVLKAIGLKKEAIESSIRISLSYYNTKEEIDKFFEVLIPFLEMAKMLK